MLPLQQAQELRSAISEYLKATFTFREKEVHEAFHEFVNHSGHGIFRGPYVSVQLPFKTADQEETIPLDIQPRFTPFLHQSTAFKRLSSENGSPDPTLLTTGTGSGKTESFLYPILDYCYKNRDKKGIKAIILYPMNALATDQAQRLAEMIWTDDRLKDRVTAGLFIGTGSGDKKYHSDMGKNHIIEDRDRIIDTKPDILLTNFKMLDYGLMRNRYHKLWTHNFNDASLLKFLVLDELHTYDGAQGTDVANLIRRLKLKLGINRGELCPVGTSATIGKGEESAELLTDYAGKIFGETFQSESVITEERLPWHQFLGDDMEVKKSIPNLERLEESRLKENDDYERYIDKQKRLWGFNQHTSPFEVGQELKKLQIFHDLLESSTEGLCEVNQLINRIADRNIRYKDLPEFDYRFNMSPRHTVLESLLAMIAYAKSDEEGNWPFLLLRVQIWIRELSGIMRFIETTPEFTWRDTKDKDEENRQALPMYFCRECGASGWLTKKRDDHNKFESDPGEIFQDYFSNHKNIFFINTDTKAHQPIEEYDATTKHNTFISKESLEFSSKDSDENLKILALRKLNSKNKSDHVCPECGSANTVSIVGTRTATLTSIAVSQTLSSNLDGREDGYRKLLAFTNSVQDAAHHAGFIEARNYRFMFRTSLQQVLNGLDEEISLTELADRFKDWWKNRGEDDNTYYYRFYPDDCAKKSPIEAYKHSKGDTFTELFKKEFDLRIEWEIFAEFGFNTLIGRTLEKTGSSTVWVPDEQLNGIYQSLSPWMESNLMDSVTDEDLKLFVSGIIYRLRVRGGIDHTFFNKYREDDVRVWNLNWLRDNRHFLNKTYHEKMSRFPKIVTTRPHKAGIMDTTYTKYQNWYHSFFKKAFPLVPDNNDVINEFYEKLFEVITEAGIFNKKHTNKEISYALEPRVFRVSKELKIRECGECGHRITTAELDPYLGYSKCQQYRCSGSYSKEVKQEYDYYNKVFNRDYSPRVISREHTGILDREDRELVEESFQSYQADRSVNTLVATSTLEMGIDIGELESSFNMGMPPLPSNYMQRIGRAGRKSGSSLISNFISQKNPHDLYYFEEPGEMMDGDIHTPGCFLNAPEILKRQFLAHCIDRWVAENSEENTIPSQIRFVKLLTIDIRDSAFFLNRLVSYILSNLDDILHKVQSVYEPELEIIQLQKLQETIESGSFTDWIITPFYSLKSRLIEIQQHRKEIDQYIKERNLAKGDEERLSLEDNKKSLYRTRRKLERQQVVEFMTLSGLLPNYAFPDKGVEFSGRIFQPAAKGSDSKPENISKEYVRPSSQAIRELAPHNHFFAEGYKFDIQGLMTHEWGGQKSTLEPFRFCSNCDYITYDRSGSSKTCPKCGDQSFGAASNVHQFAEMTGAKSEVIRDKAALDDSSDERDTVFYILSRHAAFEERSGGSLALVDIPFGIELANNVQLTEVNLGMQETVSATRLDINQIDGVPRHGFVTCKHCGYSTNTPAFEGDPSNRDKYKFHYPYCKHRSVMYEGEPNEIFEEVYLYRKQQTEALKILLPIQTFATDEFRHIFKAGIELGLKEFYKGNPAHLSFLEYQEFNQATSKFDQYLLLYDRVPGGTGYLSKLYDRENFTKILKKAYLKIKNCSCQHEGKDGCYHCVYSYRNQYVSSVLSRERAEKIFEDLLKHSSNWKSLDHALSDVTRTGQIEESELEERFIVALELWCSESGWQFEKRMNNNIQTYYITVPQFNGDTLTYWIRPQVWLGTADGVSKSTKPDFIMKPVDSNGRNDESFKTYKDIAIYLDGYQFHASKENNRFQSDIEKRKAILASERFKVWTLTWDDVDGFMKTLKDKDELFRDELSPDKPQFSASTERIKSIPPWKVHESTREYFDNSFSRLLGMLTLSEEHRSQSIAVAGMRNMKNFPVPNIEKDKARFYLSRDFEPEENASLPNSELAKSFLCSEWSKKKSIFESRVVVTLAKAKLHGQIWYDSNKFEELDKVDWNLFWRLWNLLQYGDFEVSEISHVMTEEQDTIDPDEILLLYDEELHPIIMKLIEQDVEFGHEGSYLLPVGNDAVEAQLGFEDPKVVFKPIDHHAEEEFKKQGYEIADPETFDINRLLS